MRSRITETEPGRLRARRWLACLVGASLVAACSRSSVPATTAVDSLEAAGGESGPPVPPLESGRHYGVVWVGEEGLAVRQPAGISAAVVDTLPRDARDVRLTGGSSNLGSSLWVEIFRPAGGTGWVNFWNLTEDVARDEFCSEAEVTQLAERFQQAVRLGDGSALAGLISPKRGWVYRHEWWNDEVILPLEAVPGLFQSPAELVWGQGSAGSPVLGSFSEVVQPGLVDLVEGLPEETCGLLRTGDTARSAEWPVEYRNLNFLYYYLPADASETTFGWTGWGLAVEYLDGQPLLAAIVRYHGEIGP